MYKPVRHDEVVGSRGSDTTRETDKRRFRAIAKLLLRANGCHDDTEYSEEDVDEYGWFPEWPDSRNVERFIQGLSFHRFDYLEAFLAWGADGSDWSQPERDIRAVVACFTKRLARNPMLCTTWNDASLRPRDFKSDGTALCHAKRLDIDIERVFPATAPKGD
jgi:hypothetical protein